MAASLIILKTKQEMHFHWTLPVFTVGMVISVLTHHNYDKYTVKICMLLISFLSGTANEKNLN